MIFKNSFKIEVLRFLNCFQSLPSWWLLEYFKIQNLGVIETVKCKCLFATPIRVYLVKLITMNGDSNSIAGSFRLRLTLCH